MKVSTLSAVTLFVCLWLAVGADSGEFGTTERPTPPPATTRPPFTAAPTTTRAPPTTAAPTTTRAPPTAAPTTTRAPPTAAPTTTRAPPSTAAPTTTRSPTTAAPTTTPAATTAAPTSRPHHTHPAHPTHSGHRHFPEPHYTEFEKKNINVTKTLYTGLIAPLAEDYVVSATLPAGVFSANASGRIVPVGTFEDPEGSFEYFYGLAAGLDIHGIDFVKLIAKDNIVAYQVNLLINQSAVFTTPGLENITQEGFITFTNDSLIESYDLVILRVGQAAVIAPDMDVPIMEGICEVASIYCTGDLVQYDSFEDCLGYLSGIKFGTYDNLSSNTTVCRALHSQLVPLRPWFHCPHIGPTGGTACIDTPYADFYQQSY